MTAEEAGYASMIDSLRSFLDRVAGARPTAEESAEVAATLDRLSAGLADRQVSERERLFARLSVQGRGQSLTPQLFIDEQDAQSVTGHVTFRPYFVGGNGAAHGGTIPLLFDAALGRLANAGGRRASRTAYLTVNFRSIARIGNRLTLTARHVREDGRKRVISGELRDGDLLVADAEGLFVELRPGQP
ncbi:PaaI family thioesterase [Aeromicrobium sp. S22]|uniref:PaaI family thioesterase n=1 Tax=Aeromicrobium sp. S22 TaxID=2662029 RepID=UPI001E519427|nr:PaaI family thioesterase [Aeromicrobium sp. S22]